MILCLPQRPQKYLMTMIYHIPFQWIIYSFRIVSFCYKFSFGTLQAFEVKFSRWDSQYVWAIFVPTSPASPKCHILYFLHLEIVLILKEIKRTIKRTDTEKLMLTVLISQSSKVSTQIHQKNQRKDFSLGWSLKETSLLLSFYILYVKKASRLNPMSLTET